MKRLGAAGLHLPVPAGCLGSLSESPRRFSAHGHMEHWTLGHDSALDTLDDVACSEFSIADLAEQLQGDCIDVGGL